MQTTYFQPTHTPFLIFIFITLLSFIPLSSSSLNPLPLFLKYPFLHKTSPSLLPTFPTQSSEMELPTVISDLISAYIKRAFTSETSYIKSNISPQCYNDFLSLFNTTDLSKTYYSLKLIEDSSKNRNDLSTYSDCMTKDYNLNRLTSINTSYILTSINAYNATFSINQIVYTFLIGLCLPEVPSCKHNATYVDPYKHQYQHIIEGVFIELLNDFDKPKQQHDNPLESDSYIMRMNTIEMYYTDYNKTFTQIIKDTKLYKQIPTIIALVIPVLSIINFFPFCLCKRMFDVAEPLQQHNTNVTLLVNNLPKEPLYNNESSADNSDDVGGGDNDLSKRLNESKVSNVYNNVKMSFQKAKNGEELFEIDNVSNMNNDSGLTYIKGLRAIAIIFLIPGNVFLILFNSPVVIRPGNSIFNLIANVFYFPFYMGLRFAPRILLSCSGYTLMYKYINFLDEAEEATTSKDDDNDNDNDNDETKNDLDVISNDDNSYDNNNNNVRDSGISDDSYGESKKRYDELSNSSNTHLNKDKRSKLTFNVYIKFIMGQIHKYIMYILMILFIQFSVYDFIKIVNNGKHGPTWEFFGKNATRVYINGTTTPSETPIAFVYSLLSSYSFFFVNKSNNYFMIYFWLIENEILFFVITTLIVFIAYKYKIRVDILFVVINILTFLFKLCLQFIFTFILNPDTTTLNSFFKPFSRSALFFEVGNYDNILRNPFMNYQYFLIGVIFGSSNYVLQKGMNGKELRKQGKSFLLSGLNIITLLKRSSKTMILCVIKYCIFFILIVLCLLQFIICNLLKDGDKFNNLFSYKFNWIMYFDIEVVVVLVHLLFLALYIKGDQALINFLSRPFWTVINKLYFSFILILSAMILYAFYISDSRITFNFWNCCLYSLICGFWSLILSVFVYLLYELPSKRIIKLLLNRKKYLTNKGQIFAESNNNNNNNNDDDGDDDNNNGISPFNYNQRLFPQKDD